LGAFPVKSALSSAANKSNSDIVEECAIVKKKNSFDITAQTAAAAVAVE
jgi:hypothetical protein